jgi:hypothetical protein
MTVWGQTDGSDLSAVIRPVQERLALGNQINGAHL